MVAANALNDSSDYDEKPTNVKDAYDEYTLLKKSKLLARIKWVDADEAKKAATKVLEELTTQTQKAWDRFQNLLHEEAP